ncbi:hypothetical protein L1049_011588 [Liquidambar formosana]|uniref:KIB1-4 beta-propeller domain-containing protein n=1 Tax=Liquidambar formosana TaxID=63359 RepID=A0AAP0WZX5_LIQFO
MILMAGERLVKAITGRTMMKFFPRQEFMRKTTTPRGLRHTSPSLRGLPEFLLPRQGLLRPPPLGSTFLKGQLFTMLFGRSVRFSSSSSSSSSSPVEVEEMTSPPSALVSSGLHPRSPWLMLPPELDTATGEEFDCFYSLLDKQVVKLNRKKSLRVPEGARCFGSTRGWLGFVDPKDCSLYLSNPFSLLPHQQPHSPRVIQLPPFETLAFVVGTVRNSESNVIEKFVVRMQEDGAEHDIWEELTFCPEFWSSSMPRHLAMSSDPSNEDDCVILTDWDGCREFGFCRPGRDTAWTSWDGPEWSPSEFAYSKKERRFYSIFDFGGIQALDVVGTPPKRTIIFPELHDQRLLMIGFHMRQYLVIDESSSDILLVVDVEAPSSAVDIEAPSSVVDEAPSSAVDTKYQSSAADSIAVTFSRGRSRLRSKDRQVSIRHR